MILVLDACSISNLINVFQDNSLLIEIRKCFKEIYITPEVIKEVNDNKKDYVDFFKDRWDEMEELYSKLSLKDYIHKEDKEKKDCISFLTKFSTAKKVAFNNSDGEYHSSLLSLYVSRLGNVDFAENTNKILFVTDDARAEDAYYALFTTNQVGSIIDSIDIVLILYLKGKILKSRLIQYIEGLFTLYNKELNNLKFILTGIDLKEKANSKYRQNTEFLRQLLYDGNIPELKNILGSPGFKKYFSDNKKVKSAIEKLSLSTYKNKIPSLQSRKYDVQNNLIWKV